MSAHRWWLPAILAGLFAGTPAWGAEHEVLLRRLQFQPEELHIKAGDSIRFRNLDGVQHDLVATAPGSGFEDVTVEPEGTTTVTFPKAGQVAVGCSLHDAMALNIVVEP